MRMRSSAGRPGSYGRGRPAASYATTSIVLSSTGPSRADGLAVDGGGATCERAPGGSARGRRLLREEDEQGSVRTRQQAADVDELVLLERGVGMQRDLVGIFRPGEAVGAARTQDVEERGGRRAALVPQLVTGGRLARDGLARAPRVERALRAGLD